MEGSHVSPNLWVKHCMMKICDDLKEIHILPYEILIWIHLPAMQANSPRKIERNYDIIKALSIRTLSPPRGGK